MTSGKILVDLVLPVHNEGATIEKTLLGYFQECQNFGIDLRFIISEDGSTDNTIACLQSLKDQLPLIILSEPSRKGYSRAVIDGLRRAERDFIACMDSDGQYSARDLPRLLCGLRSHEIVFGQRKLRRDSTLRRAASRFFRKIYRWILKVPAQDPSCPYLVMRKATRDRLLQTPIGILPQGFWWEFFARCHHLGIHSQFVEVDHLERSGGQTRVYLPLKMPKIFWIHLLGLFRLKREFHGSSPLV